MDTSHPNVLSEGGIEEDELEMDAASNLKPSKKKSTERIDGIVAGIMALGRAIIQPAPFRSKYETQGLTFV